MNKADIEKYLQMLVRCLSLSPGIPGNRILKPEYSISLKNYLKSRWLEASTWLRPLTGGIDKPLRKHLTVFRGGTTPWVAIGDFLDDWRRSSVEDRYELVNTPIAHASTLEQHKWAAFIAAMIEWLCWQDNLPFPEWTGQQDYILSEPWFLYKGQSLRAWQLIATPAPFKMRNIYGGDRMLDRV